MSTMTKKPHLYYMSAWFCPFAHRATLALEHHGDHLTYEWIEALGWEKRKATGASHEKGASLATEHENWYHFKAPELMKHNPLGMVPTLVSEATYLEDDSRGPRKPPVRESLVAIEFVDELVNGGDAPIMPSCPYERARARVAADVVNKQICSKYYHVLVRQDPAEQREGFEALLKGIEAFGGELVGPAGGSFFGGATSPGLVDYALFPWAHRIPVFEHYRARTSRFPKTRPTWRDTTTGSTPCTRFPTSRRRARPGTTTSRTSGATPTARRGRRWPTPCATGGTRTSTTTKKTTPPTEVEV